MGIYCTILLFFHLFYRFEVLLNKKLRGSNYNFTVILLEKNLSPMAVLEIVTNCSLRKRNPISCHGGSVVVTCVELAQRKHSAAGEQESTSSVRSGSKETQDDRSQIRELE